MGSWVHTLYRWGSRLPWQSRYRSRYSGQVLTRNRPGCYSLVVEGIHSFSSGYSRLARQMGQIVLLWRSPNASRHNCVTLHAMVRTQTSVLKEVGKSVIGLIKNKVAKILHSKTLNITLFHSTCRWFNEDTLPH